MMWPETAALTGSLFEATGRFLAVFYINYGLFFLLFGSVFLVHGLVLGYLLAGVWKPGLRLSPIVLLAEVLYGLVNPLIYLVIIERSGPPLRHWALSVAAGALLVAIWGSRFTLGVDRFRHSPAARVYVRWLSIVALAFPLGFLVKDVIPFVDAFRPGAAANAPAWSAREALWGGALLVSFGALYLIASVLAWNHLRSTESGHGWQGGRRFFMASPRIGWAAVAVVLATLALVAQRPSATEIEQLVRHHRAGILTAAQKHAVEPAVIASIIYVTQRDLTTPLADRLERLVMGAWLVDRTNNFFLAERLDVSIGVTQIKPLTAMAALVIQRAPVGPGGDDLVLATASRYYKEYRGGPRLGARWVLPLGAVEAIDSPFRGPLPKTQVVEALFDDRRNIEMCALILALYAAQWEAAEPAWAIRHRPEILATLFQIGFEKSWPKADPHPNRFGERVAEVYRSRFIQGLFGPGTGQA